MGNNIDLSNYQVRTDLVMELVDENNKNITTQKLDDITITTVNVEKEMKKLLKKIGIKEEYECLVIELGNIKSTPDALSSLL